MKTLNLFIIISFSTVYNGFVQQNLIRPKKEIKIALLGTYHFADPGQDKFNVNVDETNLRNGKKKLKILILLLKTESGRVLTHRKKVSLTVHYLQVNKDEAQIKRRLLKVSLKNIKR